MNIEMRVQMYIASLLNAWDSQLLKQQKYHSIIIIVGNLGEGSN